MNCHLKRNIGQGLEGGPNTGASVPVGFGVHQPRSSLNLIVQEFLWRLYYIALID